MTGLFDSSGTRRGLCLLLAAAALCNSGCLLVAAGAAGGAAVGYAYCQGKVCETYPASFADTWAATQTALGELGMPLVRMEHDADGGFFESRTTDRERVRITLQVQPSRIPAEGSLTQVCVRVATFGDHPVSTRILQQVSLHLAPPAVLAPQLGPPPQNRTPLQTTPPPALPSAIQPVAVPPQTAPPPLAPEPTQMDRGNGSP